MDYEAHMAEVTLAVNEGCSEIGIHHDPQCPMPALICGPGLYRWGPTGWEATGCGGRLFLADGLFDLSYGPRDVVLLDGNLAHGVTKLGDLPGQVQMGTRAELVRFSIVRLSRFAPGGGKRSMLKEGNYSGQWSEKWRDSVLYV